MWILKGVLTGVLFFFVIFAARYHRIFYHNLIDPRIVLHITVQSVVFWLGLVGCTLVGCTVARYWFSTSR